MWIQESQNLRMLRVQKRKPGRGEQHPRPHLHRDAPLILQGEGLPQGDQQRPQGLLQDEVPGTYCTANNCPIMYSQKRFSQAFDQQRQEGLLQDEVPGTYDTANNCPFMLFKKDLARPHF